MTAFSVPARLMVRPFRGYAELARANATASGDEGAGSGDRRPSVVVGMARFLFVFGAFVSLTATGRLSPIELFSAMISFSYVPVIHFIAIAVATRVVARELPVKRAFALYAEGYGPWLAFMLLVAAATVFGPSPLRVLGAAGAPLLLGATAWSVLLTFACFRSGFGLSRGRAALGLGIHYLLVVAINLGYYIAAGQLLPLVLR